MANTEIDAQVLDYGNKTFSYLDLARKWLGIGATPMDELAAMTDEELADDVIVGWVPPEDCEFNRDMLIKAFRSIRAELNR